MNVRPWSLRRRLSLALGAAALLAWTGGSFWQYRMTMREADLLFDDALVQTAQAVLMVVRKEAAEMQDTDNAVAFELEENGAGGPGEIFYQVRGPDGRLAFRSHGAPKAPLAGPTDHGFREVGSGSERLRVYTLATDDGIATIHVAQPLSHRFALARAAALRLLVPGAALLVLLVLAVAWTVRRVTDPVVRYARGLEGIALDSDAVVDGTRLPLELRPVTGAIDQLLARVHEALLHERTLTADAAHELRTPLAALRAQAQVAYRASNPQERAQALTDLLLSVDRTARVVDAVLTLARYDARSRGQLTQSCVFVDRLAHLVADEFSVPAAAAGIQIHIDSDGAGALGDEDALAVALRNLVGNALRFARQRIELEVRADEGPLRITVRDDGPGIPAEMAQRIFQRFFRGADGARNPEVGVGAGLGLAIVRRIVELHSGSIRLVPGIGAGAGVQITLPSYTGPGAA